MIKFSLIVIFSFISFICIQAKTANTQQDTVYAYKTLKAPVFDGNDDDSCWQNSEWTPIDQVWITYGQKLPATDFTGRFKVAWSEENNLLYFFVETYDDFYADGYKLGGTAAYYDFDVVELFLDEDRSGGEHTFTNNAFAYHMVANEPVDGSVNNKLTAVCDIGANYAAKNYVSHFPDYALRRNGKKYTYEFSLKVFNDKYDISKPDSARVLLNTNKITGVSVAYCDNDQDDHARDNFIGSVEVPAAKFNDSWQNADLFGTLKLVGVNDGNLVPKKLQEFTNVEISKNDSTFEVVSDLNQYFTDPEGKTLEFSAISGSSALTASVENTKLTLKGSAFKGNTLVTVVANDGQAKNMASFIVTFKSNVGVNSTRISKVSAFPNPLKGEKLQITGINADAAFSIYDLNGRLMQKGFTRDKAIKIESLNAGTYVLIINNEHVKLIIE